jgi:O-acetyl-ADP-ribose deacetylase (regulator of RNase III)
VITPGFALPARYVIHAVGPIWRGGTHGEADTLERAYESSFRVALAAGDVHSIAFAAISTGVYGFPKGQAARIALRVMRRHEASFERIVACVYSQDDRRIYEGELGSDSITT